MGVDVEAEGGGDPVAAVTSALASNRRELAQEAMDFWFEVSQEWLRQAAQNRSDLASEGRQGREQNGLYAIQQSAVPPTWEEDEDAWVFSYPHVGAIFQEFGARPHEIRARRAEMLAFEWPDAPQEVKEQFGHTEGDLVFFESINHPGIPAIGFVRKGRDKAQAALQQQDIDTEMFTE